MLKNKKILITGGGGFIGSHLCQSLVENNKITVYDNGRRDALQYTGLLDHKNLNFIKDDILNFENLRKAVEHQDIILHLAAIAGVSSYYKYPLKTMEVNTIGAYNAMKAASEAGVELFVNFSTSEVYGPFIFNAEESGETHQGPATVSRWSYSVSKLTTDHFSFAFLKEKNLPIVSVRPFNIYGPGQVGEGAIQIFARRALNGEDLVILGDGLQIRAWCYISDFIEGVLLCLENKNAVGHIFNIGNPSATVTILELAKKIRNMFESKSEIVFQENEFTDVRVRVPSIDAAKTILGFEPKVDLEEGLEKAIEWYRSVKIC